MSETKVVSVRQLEKTYIDGQTKVHALRGIDLEIPKQAFLTLAGPSGSGKSTLLNMIGALDTPDRGEIIVDGRHLSTLNGNETEILNEKQRTRLRRERIGFIFQQFNLVPVLTALENVMLPLEILPDWTKKQRSEEAEKILSLVGLQDMMHRLPAELSGGQQQRVAIGRALVKKPAIVLADEPTANLDGATGVSVIELMKQMRSELGTAFVICTHDPRMMEHAETRVQLVDGRIES